MSAHHPVILIVEDELLVRLSAVAMLEDAGFRMIEAANGDEALELLEADSDVQLLFTDIHMPGAINGLALAKRVQPLAAHRNHDGFGKTDAATS
jgi:two-component system, response regulator PdtaR